MSIYVYIIYIHVCIHIYVYTISQDYVGVREDAPWLFQNWVDSAGNPAGSMFFDATGAFHPFSGQPPLGWHDTAVYCVLPALVVLVQLVAAEVTSVYVCVYVCVCVCMCVCMYVCVNE